MTRTLAIKSAIAHFDSGQLQSDLNRRIAYRTESQDPTSGPTMYAYLEEEIAPELERMGFTFRIIDNPVSERHPFLFAQRQEDPAAFTVLTYGHGDVQLAHAADWESENDPWQINADGDRWYGRGTADNKGQHTINLAALDQVIRARNGTLGYNIALLMDMGEEFGSPGLTEVCEQLKDEISADVFIASDGPRISAEQPTIFLGARGAVNFTLTVNPRKESHHSGNWGGVLSNPAIVLSNAVATLVDKCGQITVEGLRPPPISAAVRSALAGISVDSSPQSPSIDKDWGEPGLSPSERLFGWNTIEILAMTSGNPEGPVNAIPASARAHCQLRFVVGTDWKSTGEILRKHFADRGLTMVDVHVEFGMAATRLNPENKWVGWALDSIQKTTGKTPVLLPNLAGSLPNEAFSHILQLPTIWIPHSYPGCLQHAPNEHNLVPLMRESVQVMAGIFWDLSELSHEPSWEHERNLDAEPKSLQEEQSHGE